tara:strand:- start:4101 stop:4550 length:450 start_codon:yes stop_codon:yes gene_type:complete
MGFLSKGKMVERAFTKVLSNHKSSTEKEDISEHWDISTNIKLDVKGLKKTKRSDDEPNENIHWLEIKNVNGDLGWVYGEADYFVFETIDYWIIVDKNDLQEFIKNKIEKDWVYSAALYKLYRRKGREDVITLVKTIDLMYLSSSIITKS